MKQILWTSVLSLMVAACLTACGDSSSSSSYDIPSYKNAKDLPDSCAMEVALVDTAYYACLENKWVVVTDSATVEQFKEGLDEKEIKKMLEGLEDLQANSSSSTKKKKKSTSSSSGTQKTDGSSASGGNGGSGHLYCVSGWRLGTLCRVRAHCPVVRNAQYACGG